MDSTLLTTRDVVRFVHKETGQLVTGDCVRRWERIGILRTERTAGGVRVCRPDDVREALRVRQERKETRRQGR